MRSFVADGNFKANHLKQKNDNSDVWLTSGEGFMTNTARYEIHLQTAKETKTVSNSNTIYFSKLNRIQTPTCHRHRAQLNGDVIHNSDDCTGIGGHSCARHGCFAPSSLVNFQKGERQMNMDWSLCEALATTNIGLLKLILHIYDINCQYCIHLRERIERNDMLKIPDHIELIHAIGLFHVHGHKDECLYRWATNYVPGAGVVDGEVLETLWSVLNTVSASTRTASLAHRTEILDDHMNDSNWKKMQHIGRVF
jgi:Kyakuja-Dileera-Zisupton transposase